MTRQKPYRMKCTPNAHSIEPNYSIILVNMGITDEKLLYLQNIVHITLKRTH